MEYNLSAVYSGLARCPQCGTAKPTLNLQHVVFAERSSKGGAPTLGWATYQCSSCRDIISFKGIFPFADGDTAKAWFISRSQFASLMMPDTATDLSDLPEKAGRYLAQAIESLSAPDGAVMLAGSAVDAMLKAKGYTDGTLYSRIQSAVDDHLLTKEMGEWAHKVRSVSNNPRHADTEDPHSSLDEAKASIEFAKALGEFLFVLPAKIERGKEAANKASGGTASG